MIALVTEKLLSPQSGRQLCPGAHFVLSPASQVRCRELK